MSQSNVVVTGPNAIEGTYKNIVLKSGIGFEEQTREGYCIYHVKWDYDLGGAVVDIPANVVISMEGGVISNGTLVGHDTQIIYDVPVDKAFVNVELEGTWIDDDDKQDARISELERIAGNRAESTVLPTHMGRVTLKPNIAKRSNYWFVYPYTYTQYGHEKTDNILVYFNNNKYYLPRRYADTTPVSLVAVAQDIVGEIPFSAGANIEDVATALDLQSGQYLSYDDRTKDITMPDSSTVNAYELVNDNWPLKNYTETDANLLTQHMISKPNNIYVIQYDYELASNITIPENCVLEFNGGSINGAYNITGTNTGIEACLVEIFNTDITLAGTWNVAEAYPEWFGAKVNDNTFDSTSAIQKTIDSLLNVKLQIGTYYLKSANNNGVCISMPYCATISGFSNTLNDGNYYDRFSCLKVVTESENEIVALGISRANKITDLFIRGNGSSGVVTGIKNIANVSRYHHISNVQISNCLKGIEAKVYSTSFENLLIYYCSYGIYVSGDNTTDNTTLTFIKCSVNNCAAYCFKLEKIIYASFVSCGADFVGYANEGTFDPSILEAAYVFKSCRTVSLVGCGNENCVRALKLDLCVNMNIELISLGAYIVAYETYIERHFDIIYSQNIILSLNTNSIGNLPENTKLLRYKHYMLATYPINIIGLPLNRISFDHSDEPSINDEDFQKRVIIESVTNTEVALSNNITLSRSTCGIKTTSIYNIAASTTRYLNSRQKDVFGTKTIIFQGNGQDTSNLQFDISTPIIIEGYEKVIFKNLRIKFSTSFTGNYAIKLKNTQFVFDNCSFIGAPNNIKRYFECENSQITFINTAFYNIPSNVKDVANIAVMATADLSIIKTWGMVDNKLCLPIECRVVATDGVTKFINKDFRLNFAGFYVYNELADLTSVFTNLYTIEKTALANAIFYLSSASVRYVCTAIALKKLDDANLNAKRIGTTRPSSGEVSVGFCFFDTSISKPIWVSSVSGDTVTWVDAAGTQV